MKRTCILFICLFVVSILIQAQDKAVIPPKKVNVIAIERTDSAYYFLMDFARKLQESGYSIQILNKDLLSLSTDFKNSEFAGVAVVKVIAFASQIGENSRIEIRGKIEVTNPMVSGPVPYEACNCGFIGDARKNAFEDIMGTLKGFKYSKIEFLLK